MISASVLLDSTSPAKTRLTTFVCTYPRFIHAEVMTHRMFSRNAASSRAIPVSKQIETVMSEPAMPLYWGQNQQGMQAYTQLPDSEDLRRDGLTPREYAQREWTAARDRMVSSVECLNDLGVYHPDWKGLSLHKQLASRLIEPWLPITVIISSTTWENFWFLRTHHAAQPEIQALARKMKEHYDLSEPQKLKKHEWHLPFIKDEDRQTVEHIAASPKKRRWELQLELLRKISVGRCARVSYLTHDKKRDVAKDIELHDKLLAGRSTGEPLHLSPFEHVAQAMKKPERSGNFCGFRQYRSQFETM